MANGPPPPAPLDYAAIEARIDAALRQHVPEAFRVKKLDRARGWLLEKVAPAAGEWPNQDYGLWVTEDEQWIVATFGNDDAGMGTPWQTSLTMTTDVLRVRLPHVADPLGGFLQRLLACRPNEWGYT